MSKDYVGLDDAVKEVMRRTGRTRKQAEAFLLQLLKSGKLHARGELIEDGENRGRMEVPVEVWNDAPWEH